jgi:hypothetical protein
MIHQFPWFFPFSLPNRWIKNKSKIFRSAKFGPCQPVWLALPGGAALFPWEPHPKYMPPVYYTPTSSRVDKKNYLKPTRNHVNMD